MKTAIYGAGSLGTVLGAYLARAGQPVDLVNRNQAHVEALRQHGARITSTVDFTVPVSAMTPDELRGEYDLIVLMTKQQDNPRVVAALKKHLAADGVLCTAQNGLPEPDIAAILGDDRVVGCTVAWGAMLTAPGVVQLTSDPDSMSFDIGTVSPASGSKLPMVKQVLEQMCPVHVSDNFLGARWSKLLINATFSGLSAVLGCTFGEVAQNRRSRAVAQVVIKECIDVAHAGGIRIEPVQGKDIAALMDYGGPVKKWVANRLIPVAMRKHRLIRAGMLQDIEHGKATEVDYINGVVSRYGRAHGVPTPAGDRIVQIIHAIEQGDSAPAFDNAALFADLV